MSAQGDPGQSPCRPLYRRCVATTTIAGRLEGRKDLLPQAVLNQTPADAVLVRQQVTVSGRFCRLAVASTSNLFLALKGFI